MKKIHNRTLTQEQKKALDNYISRNGSNWYEKLITCWMFEGGGYALQYPDEYCYLHQIRNTFGPKWLFDTYVKEKNND